MKRIAALVLSLSLSLLLLSGCGGSDAPQTETDGDLTQLDVVLDWYPNALHAFLYVAMEKGYYEEEGLAVNIRFPSNANDAISLVAAGQADIGLYYQQDVIQTRANQNVPVKAIGAVVQSPLNIVLSLAEQNIQSPADLVGKTVGYAGTELSEAMIRSMMDYVGADVEDVTLVDVGFDLMSSMTTGNVDATIGCFLNHEVPQMQEEGFDVSWFNLEDYGVPSYYDCLLLSSDQMIAENSDVLSAFLRASAKGFADVQADPEGSLAILLDHQNAENFPLTESVEQQSLEVLLPKMVSDEVPFLSQSDACWQENIDWMLAQGLIDRAVDLDEVRVDLSF